MLKISSSVSRIPGDLVIRFSRRTLRSTATCTPTRTAILRTSASTATAPTFLRGQKKQESPRCWPSATAIGPGTGHVRLRDQAGRTIRRGLCHSWHSSRTKPPWPSSRLRRTGRTLAASQGRRMGRDRPRLLLRSLPARSAAASFRQQMELAASAKLPIIIHCRPSDNSD